MTSTLTETTLPGAADIVDLEFDFAIGHALSLRDVDDTMDSWSARLFWPAWHDDGRDEIAASAHGWRYRWYLGSGEGRYHPHLVLDAISADTADYIPLFTERGELDDELMDIGIEPLYMADRVVVNERLRGNKLGPLLLSMALCELVGDQPSDAIAACVPSAFELNGKPDADRKLAQQRLESIWERFGFERFHESQIWTMYLGDIVERTDALQSEVIH